ncbi:uncharacterized protein LOC128726839 [Anopheles nili]|uniref:uncharacterized protein LOC128726839 n=1 Tax=Anopheles nili TaxID=185578 RepID=UPI00237BBDE3|nr:uncharacterized protein LOC128726839 [Anopheles nili]
MFKLLCLLAVLAVVSALPATIEDAPAHDGVTRRDTVAAAPELQAENEDATVAETTFEAQDDMDKAETFGYGYRKIIHVYPGFYPRYYHYGGYYPRYYYGHYGHYW